MLWHFNYKIYGKYNKMLNESKTAITISAFEYNCDSIHSL